MLPSESVNVMPRSSIASAHSFGGADNLDSIERSAVPAFVPFIPAFAMSPIAFAVSSIE